MPSYMNVVGPDGLDIPIAMVRRDADHDLDELRPGAPGQEWLAGLVVLVGARDWERMVRHRDVGSLYRVLGPAPRDCLRLVPAALRGCVEARRCPTPREVCDDPGRAPPCHVVAWPLEFVVSSWREGQFVVIVEVEG